MEAAAIGFAVGCLVVGVAGLILAIVYYARGRVWGPSAAMGLAVGAIASGVLVLVGESGWAIAAFAVGGVAFLGIGIAGIAVAAKQRR